MKNWFFYLTGTIIILLAVFAGTAILKMLNAESLVFGEVTQNDKYLVNFSTTSIIFSPTENANVYEYKTTLSPVKFDATTNDYEVLFNQTQCNVNIENGQINAEYNIKLLNTDGTIKLRDTLYITISFKTQNIDFSIKTQGGYNAVQSLNTYLNNGFNIKIIDLGAKDNGKK